jgi:hypothetical protein
MAVGNQNDAVGGTSLFDNLASQMIASRDSDVMLDTGLPDEIFYARSLTGRCL